MHIPHQSTAIQGSIQPKIFLVDDHRILLDALSCLIGDEFQIHSSQTLADVQAAVLESRPDLLILDLRMPDGEPLQLARQLASQLPEMKCMFLSMYTDPRDVKRAMESGARAFVSKRTSATELLFAIRTVLRGGRYISPELHLSEGRPGDLNHLLTDRQKEVLRLIAEGATAKEIAAQLNISARTAEFHRATIMGRLKLNSTAALTRYAVENGLA